MGDMSPVDHKARGGSPPTWQGLAPNKSARTLAHRAVGGSAIAHPRDNAAMTPPVPQDRPPLGDDDLAELEQRLDALPAPLEPLDLMALDGYLVGVLLQPRPVPEAQWLRWALDVDGRPLPAGVDTAALRALIGRRHQELNRAIHHRQWFDPWVFELDDEVDPLEAVLPWAAGFATAMEAFPALMERDGPEVLEPLAAIYRAFSPEDLEDADALLEAIEELEPPVDLAEAVEALVSAALMLADVTRPQSGRPAGRAGAPGGARRPAPRGGARQGRPPRR